jgi:hypothetical protein
VCHGRTVARPDNAHAEQNYFFADFFAAGFFAAGFFAAGFFAAGFFAAGFFAAGFLAAPFFALDGLMSPPFGAHVKRPRIACQSRALGVISSTRG